MTDQDEGYGVPLAQLASDVQAGRRSAVEVVERCLDAIAKENPRLNAIVAERALAARAEAADEDRGRRDRPLAGLPFTAKDVIATVQLPTTCGSRVMAGHQPREDATVVARLRRAGAILVGKTNCPEFAFSVDTRNDLHGRTTNPLGDFTPGGSSGGESAAVAAGMSMLGIGSDFGGSIRWPALCTGLAGLRPTVGRVPTTGLLPSLSNAGRFTVNVNTLQGKVQTVGPLGRTIADLELILSVICGPDGVDPFAADMPLGAAAGVDLSEVEVLIGTDVAGRRVEPPVADAVDFAAAALAKAGAVVRVGLPSQLDPAVDVYAELRGADPLDEIAAVSRGDEHMLMPHTRELLDAARRMTARDLTPLWSARDRLRGELLARLAGTSLLVLPVSVCLPPATTDAVASDGGAQFEIMTPSRAISLFGLPALSVPCPRAPDGRPVSVQIVGPPFREDLVFAAGRHVEAARIRHDGR
jgi:Asp-tRNA(Asn)/Glu-tRNA(Gln) amidotransferase A subunit family amidase